MNILIADDDPVASCRLEDRLKQWGYEAVTVADGTAACAVLESPNAPPLAILDWVMPGLDGPAVCRRARAVPRAVPPHLILLSARGSKQDVVAGLQSGADDYLAKPFDDEELHARLQVGQRILGLQQSLAQRVAELERSLAHVKQLHGLLPICCYCKRVRADQRYWEQVEAYVSAHSEARFSHTVCPDCHERYVRPEFEQYLGGAVPGPE